MATVRLRKKAVEIVGVQFNGNNVEELRKFAGDALQALGGPSIGRPWDLYVKTTHGRASLKVSDWVLRGVNGEFYPCEHEVLEQTYDLI